MATGWGFLLVISLPKLVENIEMLPTLCKTNTTGNTANSALTWSRMKWCGSLLVQPYRYRKLHLVTGDVMERTTFQTSHNLYIRSFKLQCYRCICVASACLVQPKLGKALLYPRPSGR
jgi:hypothetical protein